MTQTTIFFCFWGTTNNDLYYEKSCFKSI